MIKTLLVGLLALLLVSGICQKLGGSQPTKSEPVVAVKPYEEPVKHSSPLESAKMYVTWKDPTYIRLGKELLEGIPKGSKDYPESRRILARVPSDAALAALEARIKKAERKRRADPAFEPEWTPERIKLELALHPERREQMAKDMRAMHDAIKEKYGAEAVLRFLQNK